MKKHNLTILTFLMVGLFLTRCISNDNKTSTDRWFEDTKAEILKQSNLKADSTTFTFNEDSTFRREHSFSGGLEYLVKGFNKEILRLEIHYSKDGNFELRREICNNGNYGFEGIVYKNNFYGLSAWRNCKGQLDQQGIRYNGKKIGIWKTWDQTGKLTEEIDYKNLEKLDSMPIITK